MKNWILYIMISLFAFVGCKSEKDLSSDDIVATDKSIYFIEYKRPARAIRKISLNSGSTAESIVNISGKLGIGLAMDGVNNKMYFTDFYDDTTPDGKVWRMNLDGSNIETVVSGITDPYSIVVSIKNEKIYWADDLGSISRANLDGSELEREFIHIEGGEMRGLALNSKSGKIYFYEVFDENIYVANADGSGIQVIVEGAYGYSIFVDEVNSKLYYEDRNEAAIFQCNLDGSGKVKITDVPSTRVYGMGIDYVTNKFYWSDMNKNSINRSNLDGSKFEPFLIGVNSPRGFFIK